MQIALVGPSFFSYIDAITKCFGTKGYSAKFFDERHSNAKRTKILYRLGFYEMFEGRKRRHLDGVARAIIEGGFTDVLLIDVEVCDGEFVQALKSRGIRVHLYMWDSAKNKPRYLKYLSALDGKASFDQEDCDKHGLTYIPLFAEDVFKAPAVSPGADKAIDLSFCGTLHSNRALALRELARLAAKKDLRTSFLLFFHSKLLLFLKVFSVPANAWFLRTVSTTGFSKKTVAELFAGSKYVFDAPHPGQKGLTARTFEVLRTGSRLITSNPAALSLPYSLSRRVVVFERLKELEAFDFAAKVADEPLTREEDEFLSIGRFVDQLLDLMGAKTRA